MNICFPSLSYSLNGAPTSGVGSQVKVLGQALVNAGHAVSVVDLAAERSDHITDNHGVQVHRIKVGNLHWWIGRVPVIGKLLTLPLREIEYSLAVWRGVKQANRSHAIDVIEGTETGMLFLALFWRKTPVLIRLHGEQYTFIKYTPGMRMTTGLRMARVLQRIALRRVKLLISPSHAHAREIQSELGEPHPPIAVVPNGLMTVRADANGNKRDQKTVLYAGRIERRKGIETFLAAAKQTAQALPDSKFVIAGDFHSSISQTEFDELLQVNSLNGKLEVLGPVAWTKLTDLYRRASVAVLPSHYETFGLAALEPMAYGTPVIAADTSALPEVVLPGVSGQLVPAGDANALAAVMIELLRNTDVCAAMGKAAIKHAAKFDIRNVVDASERLYRWCADTWIDAPAHIFFSPHADDVVLSCGGAIQSLLTQGKNVQVVTVFAGDSAGPSSAFARHLHRKWRTTDSAARQRRQEDREALRILGVNQSAFWDYLEAPNRRTLEGAQLYATYDGVKGNLSTEDERFIDEISERILAPNTWTADSIFYFPLSIGNHVDHQILSAVGRRLVASGKHVRFYEDYPYAENHRPVLRELNWLPQIVAVPVARKLRALAAYQSQVYGLGGSLEKATKRLRQFSYRFGGASAERYWELTTAETQCCTHQDSQPLMEVPRAEHFRDFANFIRTFRWHDLDEVLPVGDGSCADIGCGSGRHKELIKSRGYKWVGIDPRVATSIRGEAESLPLANESQAAVTAWQVMEYVDNPQIVFAEVARVLEPGGVFCGSVSFLEPLHGHTYFNLSPLIVEKLLIENGFGDVTIKPGLNGFALMLWTWLRRTKLPFSERFAIPLAFVVLVPIAFAIFVLSWLSRQLGLGRGHFMQWISQTAPLEFAGHVMFCARKRTSKQKCT